MNMRQRSYKEIMTDAIEGMDLDPAYFDSNGVLKKLLSENNEKMVETTKANPDKKFVCWNLPPKITCPQAKDCLPYCYASKGCYGFRDPQLSMQRHLDLSKTDDFVRLMNDEIGWRVRNLKKRGITLYVRIHDSGDFYNLKYALKWIEIAKANPEAVFYSYTKCVRMWNEIDDADLRPSNFKIIMSEGGKQDLEIRDDATRAVVIKDPSQMTDEMMDATGNDYIALVAKIVALPIH